MSGTANHGLNYGCAMRGSTSGDNAYRRPFGGFAWIEVPTERSVTVVGMAATNFSDRSFSGCRRGSATQSPWIPGAPGSILGCVYVHTVTFRPGRHYYFSFGRISELPGVGPPQEIVDGFALSGSGIDVRTRDVCKL